MANGNVLQIFKETALPAELQSNSIYLIAPSGDPQHVEIYVTGATASVVKRTVNKADVQTMVDERLANLSVDNLIVVADIAARDALEPTTNLFVFVKDATGDSTVDSGSASYVYEVATQQFTKIAEYESTDLILSWDGLEGKPNSSVTDIDDAVSKRHSHANATELAKIGQDANGNLTYGGNYPLAGLSSVNW